MSRYECKHLCIGYNHVSSNEVNTGKSLEFCIGMICSKCKSHKMCNKCNSMVTKIKCKECVNNLKRLRYSEIRCTSCR